VLYLFELAAGMLAADAMVAPPVRNIFMTCSSSGSWAY